MDLRKLLVVPILVGALVLGACGGEEEAGLGEEEGLGVVEEEAVGVGDEAGVVGEGVVGGTEILGNGIDDDADGLIDEES